MEAAGASPDEGRRLRVLAMKDKGEMLGYAAVELVDNAVHILKLSARGYDYSHAPQGETVFVLDTLMRSAASYGETFGADEIITGFPDFFGFFSLRGFDVEDNYAHTPMSTIVHYD